MFEGLVSTDWMGNNELKMMNEKCINPNEYYEEPSNNSITNNQ
jgi:hypothetical protein